MRQRLAGWASLFASSGTLVCCALPTLLVSLGLGAAVASTVSAFPFLITLSRHKAWVFLGAGALLAGNYFWVYRKSQDRDCAPATACHPDGSLGRAGRRLYWVSLGIYAVAFYVAYLSVPVLRFFEG